MFKTYQTQSDDNRINVLPIAPIRGLIYDRNGILLAINRPIFDLEVIPEQVDALDATIQKLQQLLDIKQADVDDFYQKLTGLSLFKPITLIDSITEEQVALFSVHKHQFTGVVIKKRLKRYYPYRDLLTHAVGYVSRINAQDVKRLTKQGKWVNYKGTKNIGKQGAERYYEDLLHGQVGYQKVEVNSTGRIIRTLEVNPSIPGRDLHLNIDINLQLIAAKQIKGKKGAIILIDAQNGGILALVSSPSYDANLFVNGISNKSYSNLLNLDARPLINRATQGQYAPASTIKPFLALAALEAGITTPNKKIFDPGWFQIPNTNYQFRNWKRGGHGWVNSYEAISQSVDTYFYIMAYRLGIDAIYKFMYQFGFGQYVKIDINEASMANLPSKKWKRQRFQESWYPGDTVNIGIGQGYWTATPLQIVQAINAIANRGKVIAPKLLKQTIKTAIKPINLVVLSNNEHWQVVIDGMTNSTNKPTGTAYRSFVNASYSVAGKSGTAQLFSLKKDQKYSINNVAAHLLDNALFVAFAPAQHPQIAGISIVENAGSGGSNAAPMIRALFDSYFDNNKVLQK